jgi:mannan endo-1,6-alpha-mannosidase
MKEVACEDSVCNVDQRSFKAYLSRWMAASTKVAPFISDTIMGRLKTSATAAVKTCTGGADGSQCGLKWTLGAFAGDVGVGETMSVLDVTQSMLAPYSDGPVTAKTGGTSEGDPNAGTQTTTVVAPDAISTSDRAGAGILTAVVLLLLFTGAWWMARENY